MFDYLIYGYDEIKTIVYGNEISKAAFDIFKNQIRSIGQTGPSIDRTTLWFDSNRTVKHTVVELHKSPIEPLNHPKQTILGELNDSKYFRKWDSRLSHMQEGELNLSH